MTHFLILSGACLIYLLLYLPGSPVYCGSDFPSLFALALFGGGIAICYLLRVVYFRLPFLSAILWWFLALMLLIVWTALVAFFTIGPQP
jgi:hypothetical protein